MICGHEPVYEFAGLEQTNPTFRSGWIRREAPGRIARIRQVPRKAKVERLVLSDVNDGRNFPNIWHGTSCGVRMGASGRG